MYQIEVEAHLDESWCDSFSPLSVSAGEQDGIPVLTSHVAAQAALYGLLSKLRDPGVPLVSVKRLE